MFPAGRIELLSVIEKPKETGRRFHVQSLPKLRMAPQSGHVQDDPVAGHSPKILFHAIRAHHKTTGNNSSRRRDSFPHTEQMYLLGRSSAPFFDFHIDLIFLYIFHKRIFF